MEWTGVWIPFPPLLPAVWTWHIALLLWAMGSSSINWGSNLNLRELYYLRSRWNHLLMGMIRSGKQLSHPFSSGLWKSHAIMLSSCLCLSTHWTHWSHPKTNSGTTFYLQSAQLQPGCHHLSICRLWESLTSRLHTPYTNLVLLCQFTYMSCSFSRTKPLWGRISNKHLLISSLFLTLWVLSSDFTWMNKKYARCA